MTYRGDLEAKREEAERIAGELRAVRRKMNEIVSLDERERELEGALARASREAGEARARVSLPLLARVRIATPCNERFEDMSGDERVRHCDRCKKNVYDLSALTRDSAEALLRAHGEGVCVRFYRRADGTVMTADCARGVARRRNVKGAIGAGVAAVVIAAAASLAGAEPEAAALIVAKAGPPPVPHEVAPAPKFESTPERYWMGGAIIGDAIDNQPSIDWRFNHRVRDGF
jgi:hypothetical protein